MIKNFLIQCTFVTFLYSSQQIILVVADDFNTSQAYLESFEDGKKVLSSIPVNIGRNGLGWGLGVLHLAQNIQEPQKFEGDKKAPIGVFHLTHIFGYEHNTSLSMPYLHAKKNLICVDESNSKYYNNIITMPTKKPQSFEYMRRDDAQYALGIVVAHNTQALSQRGSCIFIHVAKAKNASTAGCTSMQLDDLQKITSWLDAKKNPILIQIPKSSSKEVLTLYPELHSSELLQASSYILSPDSP